MVVVGAPGNLISCSMRTSLRAPSGKFDVFGVADRRRHFDGIDAFGLERHFGVALAGFHARSCSRRDANLPTATRLSASRWCASVRCRRRWWSPRTCRRGWCRSPRFPCPRSTCAIRTSSGLPSRVSVSVSRLDSPTLMPARDSSTLSICDEMTRSFSTRRVMCMLPILRPSRVTVIQVSSEGLAYGEPLAASSASIGRGA